MKSLDKAYEEMAQYEVSLEEDTLEWSENLISDWDSEGQKEYS